MVHRDTGAWFGKGQVGQEVSMTFRKNQHCTPEGGSDLMGVRSTMRRPNERGKWGKPVDGGMGLTGVDTGARREEWR